MIFRKTTINGINLIKKYEGLSLTPYLCPAGYATIGYGHRILNDEKFISISEEKAEKLLLEDLRSFENVILRLADYPLSDGQFDALVSFCYNLGEKTIQNSTLINKVNKKDYHGASLEFARWVYAGGVKLPGLVKRRHEESLLFLS